MRRVAGRMSIGAATVSVAGRFRCDDRPAVTVGVAVAVDDVVRGAVACDARGEGPRAGALVVMTGGFPHRMVSSRTRVERRRRQVSWLSGRWTSGPSSQVSPVTPLGWSGWPASSPLTVAGTAGDSHPVPSWPSLRRTAWAAYDAAGRFRQSFTGADARGSDLPAWQFSHDAFAFVVRIVRPVGDFI